MAIPIILINFSPINCSRFVFLNVVELFIFSLILSSIDVSVITFFSGIRAYVKVSIGFSIIGVSSITFSSVKVSIGFSSIAFSSAKVSIGFSIIIYSSIIGIG
jgi:hypothetical protein